MRANLMPDDPRPPPLGCPLYSVIGLSEIQLVGWVPSHLCRPGEGRDPSCRKILNLRAASPVEPRGTNPESGKMGPGRRRDDIGVQPGNPRLAQLQGGEAGD